MLFDLPFSTFAELPDQGLVAVLYCVGCRRQAEIDIDDARLQGKSVCGRVRFRCTNVVTLWDAVPGHVCGTVACVTVRPPDGQRIKPNASILHCEMACPSCRPSWRIEDVRRLAEPWKPLFDDTRFKGFRCPTCRAKLNMRWSGFNGIPCTDGYRNMGETPWPGRPAP